MSDAQHPVEASATLLRAVRTGETDTAAAIWQEFADYSSTDLATALADDDARTAFWLNVYNAAVQDELRDDPSRYDARVRFFVADRVTVAGHDLSLNDIEHGILRRSKTVFGLGYLPRVLQSRFERTHRVAELDERIHFALNCGATSCPPIAAYSREGLDEELTLASQSYLGTEVDYDLDAGIVRVPQLLLWYHGDFGGRAGVLELLRRDGRLPADASPKIRYRSYDWSLELENFLDREAVDDGGTVETGAAVGTVEEVDDAGAVTEPRDEPDERSAPTGD
ncbi:DUF547 domain-containing protein [Salinigranum salinum]|uniref:DUF547 domain-containing protein n=1 Tax=Salinigranum salinum TaxID=1364937 RepID=UPI001260B082|nr:DUF547 domain-containing protein [Salinigranum salinum]